MKVTCVIDNTVAQSSPLWGEHGLSYLVETENGRLLMDTGRSGTVLMHNLERLDVDPRSLKALILSHSHEDHTGGLEALLSRVGGLPLYAGAGLFQPRFSCKDGACRTIGLALPEERLRQLADVHLSDAPVQVLPGIWTTGEVAPRPEAEGRSEGHVIRVDAAWSPDPYRDDLSLVLQTGEGLVVVCGCCHAGLLNTLAQVRRDFAGSVVAILGGTHVRDSDASLSGRLIAVLREEYGSPRLYLNHCTGPGAYQALAAAFGDLVSPCPAGTSIVFR